MKVIGFKVFQTEILTLIGFLKIVDNHFHHLHYEMSIQGEHRGEITVLSFSF